ncbi:D-2-hydroxyacid dehydrogenase family protein [Pseudorhodoferax sp. LjRoot39]|uniref:D-2-hydroxyacid dehydrogenase family protein n=1 Tax=Pseudorhodoferax sp. LjRoot39 TaxID=3342328 RepID=UPI003ED0F223
MAQHDAHSPARLRCVVLDDTLHVAADCADWSVLRDRVDVVFVHEHLADQDRLVAALADADIVVLMRERTAFGADILQRLDRLQLIVTAGQRNGALDVAAATARGIPVLGTQILETPAVELTWTLILALARRLPQELRAMHAAGPWQSGLGTDLAGATLGVIGLGRLGARVSTVARAFGMRVLAWSHNLDDSRCAACGVERAPSLTALLRASDFVSIHSVLSARTRGLIGTAQLQAMRRSAFLVNTSRAEIVDEAALLQALSAGTIAGAGLDVFAQEPLPPQHPLRSLPQVVATPHIGYVTHGLYRRIYRDVVEDIAAWLQGRRLREVTEQHPARAAPAGT